jgi:hypothetical protein
MRDTIRNQPEKKIDQILVIVISNQTKSTRKKEHLFIFTNTCSQKCIELHNIMLMNVRVRVYMRVDMFIM